LVYAQEIQKLSFGIVPQQSATKLAKIWTPLLKKISKEVHVEIRFKTAKNIPVFEKRLLTGEYDLAYMNPYHYTVFHQNPGYKAFAKQKNKKIKGIIVVHKDSQVQHPKELVNQTLAFPSPAAFAASVLPRAYFQNNHWPITPKYVSSHDSVYRSVAKKLFPAGGGIIRTFEGVAPEIRSQIKILWVTPAYTPHAFAAHPRVPKNLIAQLKQMMIALEQSAEGRNLLSNIGFDGIQEAQNEDWDDIRALKINQLDSLIDQ